LIITPQDLIKLGYDPGAIDCSGLKLTLSEVCLPESGGLIDISDRRVPRYRCMEPDQGGYYHLHPSSYIIRYGEYVKIPKDAAALAIPRSTLLRVGATLHTAVWDPGYEGRGYGLLIVYNPHGIIIRRGAQVAQLIFIRMTGESAKVYRGVYYGER